MKLTKYGKYLFTGLILAIDVAVYVSLGNHDETYNLIAWVWLFAGQFFAMSIVWGD